MKKLIQILFVLGLVVVMGGTASGETLPVGWKTPEGIIPPQCFVREWMSSDNFEAFEEKYSIKNNADFRENPGKYIGGKIPFETTLTPWGNDDSKIFLAAPYNLCFKGSLIDGKVENQQKPHVINIDGNSIEGKGTYEGERYAYNILAKVPLTVCQDLSSNLKGVCKQSFLIALGDHGGGSMGWIYEYSIHGLFSFKDNQQFIVPLKRFEKQNEATKFLKITMGGTASGQSYGNLENSCKIGPITDDLINVVKFWIKEKRAGAEQLLKKCLATKEMDVEFAKSEEAKRNNNWVLAKEIVTPLAEKGHAKSQGRLGAIYFYGLGEVPKDLKKASKWIKLGADQGDGRAQYFLGKMYLNGLEVPKDLKQAIKFLELAGSKYPKGFIPAQTELGALYDIGKAIPKNPKKAFYWYRLAAEQGVDYAQFNLGIYYFNGQGVEQDYKEALKWYTKAAKQGYANSFNHVGSLHANGQGTKVNFKEAIKWFKLAVEKGDAQAQKNLEIVEKLEKQRVEEERIAAKGDAKELFELGWKYRNENLGKAIKWYKLSAKKGNYDAQVNLQNIANVAYDDKDYKTALGIYEVLAEQGDEISQMRLGGMYEDGIGVSPDYKKAVKWHLLAAKQGNRLSQFQVGLLYVQGKGVEENVKEAVHWWEKASNQGMGMASHNLGINYANENNLVEAEKYYKIAVKQGYKQAEEELKNIKRIRQLEKKERRLAAKKEKEKAEQNAKLKRWMAEAENYRSAAKETCADNEKPSKSITVVSCLVAALTLDNMHDDRIKQYKKTVDGGFLSKGNLEKANKELKKYFAKDKSLERKVKRLTAECGFANLLF